MKGKGSELTTGYITSGVGTEAAPNLIEAASVPLRYLMKLYQAALQEREMREITVEATRARTDYNKRVVVREPSTSELGFQDLPVSAVY